MYQLLKIRFCSKRIQSYQLMMTNYQPNPQKKQLNGSLNQYTIYKRFQTETGATFNDFYLVYDSHDPAQQNKLLIAKIYSSVDNYYNETRVFQSSEVYPSHLLETNAEFIYKNSIKLSYNIFKYLNNGSLIDFLSLVQTVPLRSAKYWFKLLLKHLDEINKKIQIKHQSLYPSDILVDDRMNLIIVGWSKPNENISEKDIIYDCAEILHIMIFGTPIITKAFHSKDAKKKRYLDLKQWEKLKKLIIKKYSKIVNDDLLDLFSLCFLQKNQVTIQNILSHKVLNLQIMSPEQIQLTLKQLHQTKQNEKDNRNLQSIKRKIARQFKMQNYEAEVSMQQSKNYHDEEELEQKIGFFPPEKYSCSQQKLQKVHKIQNSRQQSNKSSSIKNKSSSKKSQSFLESLTKCFNSKSRNQFSCMGSSRGSLYRTKNINSNVFRTNAIVQNNKETTLIKNIRQYMDQNIGTGLIFDEDIAKLHRYTLAQNKQSTTSTIILDLDIVFNVEGEFSEKIDDFQTTKTKIKIQNDKNGVRKEVIVFIVESQCHNYYASLLSRLLKNQIQIFTS